MKTKRRSNRIAAVVIILISGLTACSPEPGNSNDTVPSRETSESSSSFEVQAMVTGLEVPWSIAFYGDAPLVSERDSARILEIDDAGEPREVAVIEGVTPGGEAGLLGIAIQDEYLYAYFTAEDGNRIERYPVSGERNDLSLGTAESVINGIPAASYHDGGRIAFGPDGMLYATVGDAGNTLNAQDLNSLAGKILRMTPDGEIPDDNPFPDSRVYSFGHRNPQGIAWSGDGTMYASEFGQNTWDELNLIEAGGNYGWPEVEGIAGAEGFIDPVQQWGPADASPSGIAIMDAGQGERLYIANLRGERLREVPLNALTRSTERFTNEFGRLRDVVAAPDGTLWIMTNNTSGRGEPGPDDDRIFRLNPAT